MLNKMIGAALLSAATFTALPASAAEYVVEDDDAVISTQDHSRVYGWTSERPLASQEGASVGRNVHAETLHRAKNRSAAIGDQ